MLKNKKKICEDCQKECSYWKGKKCKSCSFKANPQKPIKKSGTIAKISERGKLKKEERKIWLEEVHNFEFAMWDRQEDSNGYCYCFESGTPMHRSIYRDNLCVYSHILPKGAEKYKKYAMEEWNIKIVLPSWHTQFETLPEKAPKQYKLSQELKEIYG